MLNSKSKIGHNKKNFLDKPDEHIDITSFDSRKIIDSMGKMSLVSRDTAKASEIFGEMLKDKECSIFLTLAGSTSAGGCMQIYFGFSQVQYGRCFSCNWSLHNRYGIF